MDRKNAGCIVMKDGKFGRTYSSKGTINGKVPVYWCTREETLEDPITGEAIRTPVEYSKEGVLVDPQTLILTGYIN